MTPSHEDRLAELFDALAGLDAAARARALDAAGLEPAQRAELEALLEADRSQDTRLDRALSGAALRLRDLAAAPLPQGATIGAWRIERELGAGGMGTVFLARRADAGDEQRGALKLLRGFPTEEGRKRLRQERRVLAALEHPYIARLLDGGETPDGQPYLVMAYVEGETVTAFAARRAPDAAARVALIDRIAEAVAHAHQRLVIHRDLKPSNVLVRDDGTPQVLDFGVAKLIDAAGDTGGTSTRVWTPGYASPEQKAGAAVTTAADVHALGVLLGELLSGKRPDGAACEPPLAPAAIDADLRGIVATASAEDPAARYATVEALRDDLARWRDGRPVRAARDTALYRVRKFVRRHRGSVSLVLLVLIALGAFVWRLGIERDRALQAEALAEQRLVAAEQAADTARGTLDFFAGVLAEVAPDRTASRAITLDDWLAGAARRLDRELPAQSPQAALYGGYLGVLQASLGDTAAARDRLEASLAQLEARGLADGAMYASLADQLAGQLMNSGRTQDAAAWSRRAATAWRRLADGGAEKFRRHAAIAEGYADYVLGDMDAAVASYRTALALPLGEGADPEARDLRAQAAYVLGAALNTLGRSEEAQTVLDDALRELEANGGGASTVAARLQQSRSETLSTLGRSADALLAVDAALAIAEAIFGSRGSLRVNLLNQRGVVLNDLGRYAAAREALDDALAAARNAGEPVPAAIRSNLANACDSIGDNACAREQLEQLLADPQALEALLPQQRRQLKQMLGRSLSQAGDYDAARRVLEQALAEVLAEDGATSPNAAATLIHLARNDQRDARWDSALDYARRTREAYAAIVPAGHYIFHTIDRIEGYVALGQGRLDDAARLIEGYHAATVVGDGADSFWAALAALDLAALRHAQGRDADARDLLRRYLPQVRDTVLPTHPDRAAGEALARRLGGIEDAAAAR
jgi:serine/threonine-protein kinase